MKVNFQEMGLEGGGAWTGLGGTQFESSLVYPVPLLMVCYVA